MNNRTIDAMRPGEHGELNVPRNGNVAQRQRENAAQASPAPGAHAARPLSAAELCYRVGLPEAMIPIVQRVLNAEAEVFLLQEDIRSLKARLSALEKKV